ncbi:MAG: hypothetical protein ACXWF6_08310, partial [Usitatibacter sp.]
VSQGSADLGLVHEHLQEVLILREVCEHAFQRDEVRPMKSVNGIRDTATMGTKLSVLYLRSSAFAFICVHLRPPP